MAGGSSDLLECVCVCCVCVCVLVVLFHFLCLSSLSIHSFSPSVHDYSLFLSLQEQHWWKRWAVFPSIHPLFIHSLVFSCYSSLSSSMFSTCGLTGLLGTLHLLFPTDLHWTSWWIRDLHWTSWELFNYRDSFIFLFLFYFYIYILII